MTSNIATNVPQPPEHFRKPALLLIFLFTAIYAMTCLISPLNGEDYALSMPFRDRTLNVFVAILRHSEHQMSWNARLGEQLSILWLGLPKPFFVATDTLAFLILTYGMASIARRSARLTSACIPVWALSLMLTYLFWPRLEIFFWETAAAGYLQPLACIVLVLLPFALADAKDAMLTGWPRYFLMLVLGFLAGAAFENVGPALVLYMAAATLVDGAAGQRVRKQVGLLAAYLCGWACLIAAPSTRLRNQYYKRVLQTPPFSLHYALHRVLSVAHSFVLSTGYLLLCAALLYAFLRWTNRTSLTFSRKEQLLLLCSLLPVIVTILAPYTEARSFALFWSVMIVTLTRLVLLLNLRVSVRQICVAAIIALAFWRALLALHAYREFALKVTPRSAFIRSRAGSPACKSGVGIKLIRSSAGEDLLNDREAWISAFPDYVSDYFACNVVVTGWD